MLLRASTRPVVILVILVALGGLLGWVTPRCSRYGVSMDKPSDYGVWIESSIGTDWVEIWASRNPKRHIQINCRGMAIGVRILTREGSWLQFDTDPDKSYGMWTSRNVLDRGDSPIDVAARAPCLSDGATTSIQWRWTE